MIKNVPLNKIAEIVGQRMGLNLYKNNRKHKVIIARSLYYSLSKELTNKSLEKIGAELKKDHATVIHGLKMYENTYSLENNDLLLLRDQIKTIIIDYNFNHNEFDGEQIKDLKAELSKIKYKLKSSSKLVKSLNKKIEKVNEINNINFLIDQFNQDEIPSLEVKINAILEITKGKRKKEITCI